MIDHHNENVTFKMEITKKFTDALTNEAECSIISEDPITKKQLKYCKQQFKQLKHYSVPACIFCCC